MVPETTKMKFLLGIAEDSWMIGAERTTRLMLNLGCESN